VLSYFFIIQEQWAFEKYALDLVSSGGTDGPLGSWTNGFVRIKK
jgi:hypothetical protein